jgi:hypothetical protein
MTKFFEILILVCIHDWIEYFKLEKMTLRRTFKMKIQETCCLQFYIVIKLQIYFLGRDFNSKILDDLVCYYGTTILMQNREQ